MNGLSQIQLIEHLDQNVYVVDPSTFEIVYANRAFYSFFDTERLGQCYYTLFNRDERCEGCPLVRAFSIDAGRSQTARRELRLGNRWYRVTSKPFVTPEGQTLSLNTVCDITDERKAYVENSELLFIQILEAFPVAVAILDARQNVRLLNQAAAKLFGLQSITDIINQSIYRLFGFRDFRNECSADIRTDQNKFIFTNASGKELIVYRQAIPFDFLGSTGFIVTYLDITEIERAREGEAASNRAKSDFLAKMSHEIRTPLHGVITLADLLYHADLAENYREHALIIKRSGDLLLSIINDILDFSKIEAKKMEIEEIPYKLHEELKLTLDSFRFQAKEKNLELLLDIHSDVPNKVIGDPFRLRQILSNLIGNAIKFTTKGKIVLSVEFIRESFGTVVLLFNVEDTGIGIPKDKLNTIFASFTQADGSTTRKYGGTGLGTTISKQLVEMMEGEIWADSPSGLSDDPACPGSKFSFTIEVFNDQKVPKKVQVESVTSFSQLPVLIIDERGKSYNSLKENFEKMGIPVDLAGVTSRAGHFNEGHLLETSKYKLIFIEDSPTFDAFSVARYFDGLDISERHFVVILSSNDKIGNYAMSRRLMVDFYVEKPYETTTILSIIKSCFPYLELADSSITAREALRESLNILVAEDNPINQRVAKTVFKSIGYEIDVAENGQIALQRLREKKYDVVFMDFMMPIMDGLEATSVLRKEGFTMPVVAMTANATEEDRRTAMTAGLNDYISKPFLAATLRNVLAKWFLQQ